MRLFVLWFVAAVIVLTPARFAWATRQVPLAPEQLATAAECIVKGVVRSLEVRRDAAGRIVTRFMVGVDEQWKGDGEGGGALLAIELGGGTLGEVRLAATEFRWPEVGDAAVWFLKRNPSRQWSVVALDQGCYRIGVAATATGAPWVWNSQSGHPVPGLPRPLSERQRLTLEELRRRVLAAVKEDA